MENGIQAHTNYHRRIGRAHVELRDIDEGGSEMIATAI
jgi:hypothetical protein